MLATTLIVPGLYGSGEAHWQSWMETRIAKAERVVQRDWSMGRLDDWADVLTAAIDRQSAPVWIVAHSFGCLAAVVAAKKRADRVAGALLVAPANPERFSEHGLEPRATMHSIAHKLPTTALGFPSIVVASTNDPWMRFTTATVWAERWGSRLVNLGAVGHINVESGFGPWPQGLRLFESLRDTYAMLPRGELGHESRVVEGRSSYAEAALRRQWFA